MATTIKSWTTNRVIIAQIEDETPLNHFTVTDRQDGTLLGIITPIDVINQSDLIDELNIHRCPIDNAWEDGKGNTCTMEGWGGPIGEGDHIPVEGHRGTWYVIDQSRFRGKFIYLLESEQFGQDVPCIIVNQDLKLLAEDVYNGFEDLEGWIFD